MPLIVIRNAKNTRPRTRDRPDGDKSMFILVWKANVVISKTDNRSLTMNPGLKFDIYLADRHKNTQGGLLMNYLHDLKPPISVSPIRLDTVLIVGARLFAQNEATGKRQSSINL